jgi:hypothetical protein
MCFRLSFQGGLIHSVLGRIGVEVRHVVDNRLASILPVDNMSIDLDFERFASDIVMGNVAILRACVVIVVVLVLDIVVFGGSVGIH